MSLRLRAPGRGMNGGWEFISWTRAGERGMDMSVARRAEVVIGAGDMVSVRDEGRAGRRCKLGVGG